MRRLQDFLPSPLNPLTPKRTLLTRRLSPTSALPMALILGTAIAFLILVTTAIAKSVDTADGRFHATPSSCRLDPKGRIRHVIYIQFDNVHFTRDNPNVPSDLEQMPHLLNFLKDSGTLLANHHTPLISHTADDIVTSITGVYGDRQGQPIANSYGFFNSDGSVGFESSFTYWTEVVPDPANSFNMLAANGMNAPAPWVPYTRAGCDFGAVSTANIELENTDPDVALVFGKNSPEAKEAKKNPNKAYADFVGISVHCAKGGGICNGAKRAVPDVLPEEPRGYSGFDALYGHKYVVPEITPNGVLKDLNGKVITGFPGFDSMVPAISLAYVAAMQENGVPVTFAYVADAHDNHTTGNAFGPGQAGYVAQLQAYDKAFGEFFSRLQGDGIDPSNTLFVVTADEGDHFAGGQPSPLGCDGVTKPCHYSKIGEIDVNVTELLQEKGITTPFDIHFDMAPSVYIDGDPDRTDPTVRTFERGSGGLIARNPITGYIDRLTKYMADPVELRLLHMITADKYRTPTFVLFGNPDYFFVTSGKRVVEDPSFAWNHGGVAPEINTTWLGIVGPGVKTDGVDHGVWSDHTDIRPTMLLLEGLQDDYSHDGRALVETLDPDVLPENLRTDLADFIRLAALYKQINAPVGGFGLDSLKVSTKALESNDANDQTYTVLEDEINGLTNVRNTLAGDIKKLLEDAEFHDGQINHGEAQRLSREAENLLREMHLLTP